MGFTEILTIIFVLCKVFGLIDWPWLVVFMPEIIAVAMYILFSILHSIQRRKIERHINKLWKNF